VCFRSNVWNIGAEGQFVTGAHGCGRVAMQAGTDGNLGRWIVVAILLAGVLGGMAWAGIVALLRDRFNANEILVSLMLVYVADILLSWLVYGPWKDPAGYNFPQTITFAADTQDPSPDELAGAHRLLLALAGGLFWAFLFRTYARLCAAGRRAGAGGGALRGLFVAQGAIWVALLVSGGMAGLAGALEAAGPLGQLTPLRARGLRLRRHHRGLRRAACTRWASSSRAS
jgi:ABC-type uncharacterized transport system permease subunit